MHFFIPRPRGRSCTIAVPRPVFKSLHSRYYSRRAAIYSYFFILFYMTFFPSFPLSFFSPRIFRRPIGAVCTTRVCVCARVCCHRRKYFRFRSRVSRACRHSFSSANTTHPGVLTRARVHSCRSTHARSRQQPAGLRLFGDRARCASSYSETTLQTSSPPHRKSFFLRPLSFCTIPIK